MIKTGRARELSGLEIMANLADAHGVEPGRAVTVAAEI